MSDISSVISLVLLHLFVALIVFLPKQDKITEKWARLFSLAQVIMAIQAVAVWLFRSITADIPYSFSALNNLFFLGAALILLDRTDRSGNWRYLFSHRLFQSITLVTVLALSIKVPVLGAGESLKTASDLLILSISILVYLVE